MKDGHRHNFPRRLRALIGAAAFAALLAAGNSLKVQATESISVKSERTYRIISLVVDGANRTDVGWLTDYLDLDLPTELSDSEIIRIRAKLMTTEVFQRVDAEARLATFSGTDYVLAISLRRNGRPFPSFAVHMAAVRRSSLPAFMTPIHLVGSGHLVRKAVATEHHPGVRSPGRVLRAG